MRGSALAWAGVAAAVALAMCGAGVGAAPLRWERVSPTTAAVMPPRKNHCAAFDSPGRNIVVFGGRGGPELNDVWLFNVDTHVWSEVTTTGTKPNKRFTPVCGIYQPDAANDVRGKFIMATGEGKVDGTRTFFNDIWELDLTTAVWTQLNPSGPLPGDRYGAAGGIALLSGTVFYVTHGFKGDTRWDDTYAYFPATNTWKDVTPTDKRPPYARCLHSAVVTRDSQMSMFSGCGSGGFGPCPGGNAWTLMGHAASNDMEWFESETPCFPPRIWSGMGLLNIPNAPEAVGVFGGKGGLIYGNGEVGQLGYWDTASDDWKNLKVGSWNTTHTAVPSIRDGPAMTTSATKTSAGGGTFTYAAEYTYMIGGSDGGSEVWRLRGDSVDGVEELDCPFILNIRLMHGMFMLISWGFLLPIGVTIARFGRHLKPKGLWFKIHRPVQYTGVIFMFGGMLCTIWMNTAGKFSAIPHSIIGALVFIVGLQQPFNALCRCEPPTNKTKKRLCWEYWHKYAGRFAAFFGLLNPFWGLIYLDTRHRAAGPGFIIYSIWVFALVCFWVYMTVSARPGKENPSQIARKVAQLRGVEYRHYGEDDKVTDAPAVEMKTMSDGDGAVVVKRPVPVAE